MEIKPLKNLFMKREKLGYLIAGFVICIIMSMTLSDAQNHSGIGANGIVYSIPAKPKSTVYVRGTDNMYKYIKKGYQVQSVEAGGNYTIENHCFLMVKY